MSSFEETDIPKFVLLVINQLYSIEYKLGFYGDVGGIQKNVDCLKQALAAENLFFEDPMGQPYDEKSSGPKRLDRRRAC
ncbi:MAG: hypothetical protein EON54_07925 [Alcaligenaceae bacterium]|nr:MAG: hypothetical protein EON54_07925 [Alcaligenaceae bacterium]